MIRWVDSFQSTFFHKYIICVVIYNMNNLKTFSEYINESKSDRKIVQDLARHLSFDKEIVAYLNTARSRREEGWREILARKLHGKQLDYINYITKNMVADYNPRITGVESSQGTYATDDYDEDGKETVTNKLTLGEIVSDIDDRVSDIEDTLGIDPNNAETIDKVKHKLKEVGYEPDWIDEETKEEPEEE